VSGPDLADLCEQWLEAYDRKALQALNA